MGFRSSLLWLYALTLIYSCTQVFKWFSFLLQPIAKKMGLDTSANATLWKDRACVEVNYAVMTSFQVAKLAFLAVFISV